MGRGTCGAGRSSCRGNRVACPPPAAGSPPMKRRLLNLLTLLSLLLFVAVCMLWVRSYRVGSVFGYYTERAGDGWYRSFSIGSNAGRITLVPLHSKFDNGLTRGRFHACDDASKPQPRSEWAGFGYLSVQGREMGWMEF